MGTTHCGFVTAVVILPGTLLQVSSHVSLAWLLVAPRMPVCDGAMQEARRHRQLATVAEQALAEVQRQSVEAKQQLANPLQHPLVRGFVGRH